MHIQLLWVNCCSAAREHKLTREFEANFYIKTVTPDVISAQSNLDFDILVFEFDAPESPHLELMTALKSQHPSVPLLVFVAHSSEELATWMFRCGVLDYFCKPVPRQDLSHLQSRLLGILNEKRWKRRSKRSPIKPNKMKLPGSVISYGSSNEKQLLSALLTIDKQFHRKITEQELAHNCNLSVPYFSRLFKRTFGLTLTGYILQRRMNEAISLLQRKETPISTVALSVGFSDTSYFSRIFHREMGMTPTEFRRQSESSSLEKHKGAS